MPLANTVIAAVPDLFFGSKISGTAKPLGVEVKFVRDSATLLRVAGEQPSMLLIDLGAADVDPIASIRAIRSDAATSAVAMVAFANHEREDLMKAASEAGCPTVMTRGAFASALPQLLSNI